MSEPVPHRYRLTIAYDGHDFHGWQKQEPPDQAPLRTVQGVVESTLRQVLRQPLELVGASRTDARVHARGQTAHFDAATPIPIERMGDAINSRLPNDIDIVKVEIAPDDFHAIQHVTTKQYCYRLWNTRTKPLGLRWQVYHCWVDLDVDAMNDAAARIVGTHDFEGFSAAGHGRDSTVRTIHRCEVVRHVETPEVHILVEGDGFLYNMVRIIAGTLVEVGRHRFEPAQIDKILETTNRRDAGPTLPPEGLCLEWIQYRDPAGNADEGA